MSNWIDYADMGVDNEPVEYQERSFPADLVQLLLAQDTSVRLVEQQEVASWLTGYSFESPGVLSTEHDDDELAMAEARQAISEHLGELEELGYVSPDPSQVVLVRER